MLGQKSAPLAERRALIRALGILRERTALPVLRALAMSKDAVVPEAVKAEARQALSRIEGK
jgi:hypothetical protein